MSRRVVALVLVLVAASADAAGAHGLAFYALLASVPAAGAAALASFGRMLDRGDDEVVVLQALLWALALVLLVAGCAARSPAVTAGALPPLGASTLVATLAVLCVKAVLATGAQLRVRLGARRPVPLSAYSRSTSAS